MVQDAMTPLSPGKLNKAGIDGGHTSGQDDAFSPEELSQAGNGVGHANDADGLWVG